MDKRRQEKAGNNPKFAHLKPLMNMNISIENPFNAAFIVQVGYAL